MLHTRYQNKQANKQTNKKSTLKCRQEKTDNYAYSHCLWCVKQWQYTFNWPSLLLLRGLFDLFVGFLTSQQHASVSQGWICSDNFTCCHTEIEVADQIFYLTQSQYTDTRPTSPSADLITPGAWQGSHWSANF